MIALILALFASTTSVELPNAQVQVGQPEAVFVPAGWTGPVVAAPAQQQGAAQRHGKPGAGQRQEQRQGKRQQWLPEGKYALQHQRRDSSQSSVKLTCLMKLLFQE